MSSLIQFFRLFRRNQYHASARLARYREWIIKQWVEDVRRKVPGAADVEEIVLINGMHEFLDALAKIISTKFGTSGGERLSIEMLPHCRAHGAARAQLEAYTLDQVISEYRILRHVILRTLHSTGGLTQRELDKLLESIDYGMVEAGVQFTVALYCRRNQIEQSEFQDQLDVLTGVTEQLRGERSSREEFVSTLSHDLRTPLTAVLLAAQLLRKGGLKPEMVRRLLTRIVDSANRVDRMIRDLLDANRIRAGERLQLHLVEADVTELAQSTLEELTLIYGDRFKLVSQEHPSARIDIDGVRRMLENLAGNAVKYGHEGTPITLRIEQNSTSVILSVHNEGPALSAEDQNSLFDPFHRTKSATEGDKKGWGIGLTLVKGMAESHGGKVDVSSPPGRGTTFTIYLPRESGDARRIA